MLFCKSCGVLMVEVKLKKFCDDVFDVSVHVIVVNQYMSIGGKLQTFADDGQIRVNYTIVQ